LKNPGLKSSALKRSKNKRWN